jgi:hypothetical protein
LKEENDDLKKEIKAQGKLLLVRAKPRLAVLFFHSYSSRMPNLG